MTLREIRQLAINRRQARWNKEAAEEVEHEKGRALITGLAKWKKVQPDAIKMSNVACFKAPADLGCTYVASINPYRNPCIFCGHPEEDVF